MLLVSNLVFTFFSMPFLLLLPGFVKQVLGGGPEVLGVMMSAVSLGALACSERDLSRTEPEPALAFDDEVDDFVQHGSFASAPLLALMLDVVFERDESEGVRFLVVRQHADRNGGWHTEPEHIRPLVAAALEKAREFWRDNGGEVA